MAMPHNSNGSGAQMFKLEDFDGNEFGLDVSKSLRITMIQLRGFYSSSFLKITNGQF